MVNTQWTAFVLTSDTKGMLCTLNIHQHTIHIYLEFKFTSLRRRIRQIPPKKVHHFTCIRPYIPRAELCSSAFKCNYLYILRMHLRLHKLQIQTQIRRCESSVKVLTRGEEVLLESWWLVTFATVNLQVWIHKSCSLISGPVLIHWWALLKELMRAITRFLLHSDGGNWGVVS